MALCLCSRGVGLEERRERPGSMAGLSGRAVTFYPGSATGSPLLSHHGVCYTRAFPASSFNVTHRSLSQESLSPFV